MRTIYLLLIACLFVPIAGLAETFDVVLMDNPAIKLTFDRKYEVYQITDKKKKSEAPDPLVYMMLPADQQSAVTFAMGYKVPRMSEDSIAEMHKGAKITKVDCAIGQIKAQWWHYRDAQHLYSSCMIKVPRPGKPALPVCIDLIANTPERLASLDKNMAHIGHDWIVIANPEYGSFESSPFGNDYKKSADERRQMKIDALPRTMRSPVFRSGSQARFT